MYPAGLLPQILFVCEMHTLTVLYDSAVCSHHTLIEPGIPIGIAHLPKAAHVLFSSNKLAC